MKIKTIEKEVYSFEDLKTNEELKEKVLQKYYDINVDYDWYDFIYEDAKTIGDIMGIKIDNIYFSGFSSQGDGACFDGYYSYKKNSVKELIAYAPLDKELLRIATGLKDIQKKHFYNLSATIKHSGHYYNSGCTEINVQTDKTDYYDCYELEDLLRSFMDWIYTQLDKNYEFYTSEEAILETLEVNEYEFDSKGNIF